jgi:hypothetical protein
MGRRVQKTVYAYGSGSWQVQKEVLFVYDGWEYKRGRAAVTECNILERAENRCLKWP